MQRDEAQSLLRIRRFCGSSGLIETRPEIRLRKEDQEAKEVTCNRLSHPDRIENIIRLWLQQSQEIERSLPPYASYAP